MSQKNTLLALSFATLFTLSINAGEDVHVDGQIQKKLEDLVAENKRLTQETEEVDALVEKLNGGKIPLELRARRGGLLRELMQLQEEAKRFKDQIKNK